MKDTGIMKEITNKNVDVESSKQIKENPRKDVRAEVNSIRNISGNCKNATLEKILKNEKINF